MDLNNIAEQVTITVVSATVLWLGSRLAMTIWSKTAQLAARLKKTHQNSDLIATHALAAAEAEKMAQARTPSEGPYPKRG